MKIRCTACSYESCNIGSRNLLLRIIARDGGFVGCDGYFCPNGHKCRVVKGRAGIKKMPGETELPKFGSDAWLVLETIYNLHRSADFDGIRVEDLTVKIWQSRPERFGLREYTAMYPDSNKVQTILSSKRMKLLLRRPKPCFYALTDKAKELMNEHSKSEREGKGHNSARNGGRTVERTIRTGRVSRIVGRGVRNELATSKRS